MINDSVDRRVYKHKAYWKQALSDKDIPINYDFLGDTGITYAPSYEKGIEQIKITYSIVVFGNYHFTKGDLITFHKVSFDEITLKVITSKPIFFEPNVLISDLLKPRIIETQLILQ